MTADASDDIHTYQTPPSWAVALVGSVDELLLEQAHLEKKAAAAAVAFLFRLRLLFSLGPVGPLSLLPVVSPKRKTKLPIAARPFLHFDHPHH